MPDGDAWAAFTAAPTSTVGPVPPVAAPTSDGWEAFTAPAASADATQPATRTPTYDEYNAAGQWIGTSDEGYQGPYAKLHVEPPKTGYLANATAGLIEGAGGVLNTFADPVGNLIGKPLSILGTAAHDALAPYLGYEKFTPQQRNDLIGDEDTPQPGTRLVDAAGRAMGAPATADVQPATPGESLTRKALAAGTGMAALGGGSLLRSATVNPALGVSGALGGAAAADLAPEAFKPVAEVAGNAAGMMVPVGAGAVLRTAAKPVAAYLAPMTGRVNPLTDLSGAPILSGDGVPLNMLASTQTGEVAPLAVTNNQARLAGQRLRGLSADPAGVRAALADQTPPAFAGSPTTAQLTGDPGLLTAERGISRTVPGGQGQFLARAAAENDTRVGMLRSVAEGGDPAALPAALQGHAASQDQLHAQQVQTAQGRAATALDAVPSDLPAGSDALVGAAARAPVAAESAAERAATSALYEGINPDGKLAVDFAPLQAKLTSIQRQIGPLDARPEGAEAKIYADLQGVSGVQPFADLQGLTKRITGVMRGAKRDPERGAEYARLSTLLSGVHDTMAQAVADATPGSDGPLIASANAPPQPAVGEIAGAAPTTGTTAYTPSGNAVGVRYVVREAGNLIPSQMPDGRANPAFPQELQPRDRTRAASQQQVNSIANRLNPELLGASASTAEGAPIIGPDGIVESGNGRTMAIQKAYADGSQQADAYRQWIASQGYDIAGMKAPILVRERTTPMDTAARARFADDAGASPVLSMSASERAAADSKRIPSDTLSLYRGGDVTSRGNADFVRAFASNVVPDGEHASFMTSDGELSAEGADRMRNALAQRAYGSNSLVSALTEHADENIKAFGGALLDAAGGMAKLRGAIEAGTVGKSIDLAPDLIEAAGLIQTAKRARISLADAVAQRDAFSQRGERVETILRAAFGEDLRGRMSRARFADLLIDYSENAQVQSGLFGANETSGEMFANARARYGYGTGTSSRSRGAGVSVGDGQSVGLDWDQAQRPVDGASGQANAGSPAPNPAAAAVPTQAPLAPNFDQAAADRYLGANAKFAADVARFRNAPGVGQILKSGPTKGTFETPDSGVPALIARVGPPGRDVALAYLKAGGTPADLENTAAYSLRQFAVKDDGTLDVGKTATWIKQRAPFLSVTPELTARFRDAASAQSAVDQAMATRADAAVSLQKSAVGKFLGEADPVTQVAWILRSPTAVADMRLLAQSAKGDADATAGLQRAVADHILRDLKGDALGAGGTESFLHGAQFQKFLRQREPALRQVLTAQQMTTLSNVAASLERSNLSVTGSKLAGGSDSLQIASSGASAAPTTFLAALTQKLSASFPTAAAGIGAWFGGPVGAAMGFAGAAGLQAIQAARQAGLRTVDDLVANAMLHPQLAAVLLAKVTDANRASLGRALVSQLRRISLVSSAVGQQDQRQPATDGPPRNAMLH